MVIEIEKLEALVVEADKIFLTAEGEEVLLQLLDIQDQVQKAIDIAKVKLEQTALSVNANFSSIQGDKVKVFYRSYGARYKIDESLIDQIPKELYKTKVSYSADAKQIEKWTTEHKGIPIGILEPDRPKQLSIGLKGQKDDSQE